MSLRASLTLSRCLPEDFDRASLVARVWVPALGGPTPALVRLDGVYNLAAVAPTVSQLLELDQTLATIHRAGSLPRLAMPAETLANSAPDARDPGRPWFLAPCDLQPVKAAGVTFVSSMLERVIEEQARGDPGKAESTRTAITAVIGDNLSRVRPGSPESAQLKKLLVERGAWS